MATPGLVQLGFYLMEATVKGGTSGELCVCVCVCDICGLFVVII